jgi:hypothetical protein
MDERKSLEEQGPTSVMAPLFRREHSMSTTTLHSRNADLVDSIKDRLVESEQQHLKQVEELVYPCFIYTDLR